MFDVCQRFDNLSGNVAGQQEVIKMNKVRLRYDERTRCIIMRKQTKILFDWIIVSKVARYLGVTNSVQICHGERRSIFIVCKYVVLTF